MKNDSTHIYILFTQGLLVVVEPIVWRIAGVRIPGLMSMEDWDAMRVASSNADSVTRLATSPVPSRLGSPPPQGSALVSLPLHPPPRPHHQDLAAAEARATLTPGVETHHLTLMGVWAVQHVAFRPADSVDTSTGQPVSDQPLMHKYILSSLKNQNNYLT